MNTPLEQKHKIIIAVHYISAAAIILFWGGYYLLPLTGIAQPAVYAGIPDAIPIPDSILAILMIMAGFLMFRRNKAGILLSFFISGGLIFLGIAGFRFDLSSGSILISMVTALKSGFVNLWCVIFGLYILLKLIEKKKKEEIIPKI